MNITSSRLLWGILLIFIGCLFIWRSIKNKKKGSDVATIYRTLIGAIGAVLLGLLEIFGC
jgi:putative Mn2+ efflux pump MntP